MTLLRRRRRRPRSGGPDGGRRPNLLTRTRRYGLVAYYAHRRRREIRLAREIIAGNLNTFFQHQTRSNVLPQATREIVRSYRNNYRYLGFFPWEWAGHRVFVRNIESLETALQQRRGAIVASLHSGNYYAPAVELARMGLRVTVVLGRGPNQLLMVRRALAEIPHLDVDMVSTETLGPRDLIRRLRAGRLLYVLADGLDGRARDPSDLSIPFMQGRLRTKRGIAWLHKKSEAPIVPFFPRDSGAGVTIAEVGEAIDMNGRGSCSEHSVLATTFAQLERFLTSYPFQWHYWAVLKGFDGFPGQPSELLEECLGTRLRFRVCKKVCRLLPCGDANVLFNFRTRRSLVMDKAGARIVRRLWRGTTHDDAVKWCSSQLGYSSDLAKHRLNAILLISHICTA